LGKGKKTGVHRPFDGTIAQGGGKRQNRSSVRFRVKERENLHQKAPSIFSDQKGGEGIGSKRGRPEQRERKRGRGKKISSVCQEKHVDDVLLK